MRRLTQKRIEGALSAMSRGIDEWDFELGDIDEQINFIRDAEDEVPEDIAERKAELEQLLKYAREAYGALYDRLRPC